MLRNYTAHNNRVLDSFYVSITVMVWYMSIVLTNKTYVFFTTTFTLINIVPDCLPKLLSNLSLCPALSLPKLSWNIEVSFFTIFYTTGTEPISLSVTQKENWEEEYPALKNTKEKRVNWINQISILKMKDPWSWIMQKIFMIIFSVGIGYTLMCRNKLAWQTIT